MRDLAVVLVLIVLAMVSAAHVAEDERDLGLVRRVGENLVDDLQY